MAIREIIKYPNPILEKEMRIVEQFDSKLKQILEDMYDTMVAYDGIGLAAPQIGLDAQIAIVDIDDQHGTIEFINPKIIAQSGSQIDIEGCLSFPNLSGDVRRATYVKIQAQNRLGKPFILEARGLLARVCLHEIDHLHGILFTSKVVKYYQPEELKDGKH